MPARHFSLRCFDMPEARRRYLIDCGIFHYISYKEGRKDIYGIIGTNEIVLKDKDNNNRADIPFTGMTTTDFVYNKGR